MNIWEKAPYDKRPGCSQEDLNRVEEHFKVKLPEEMKEQYLIQNGGYLEKGLIPVPTEIESGGYFEIGFLEKVSELYNTEEMIENWEIPKEKYIFISGDGHWFLALYYENDRTENPSVVFIDTEEKNFYTLAESFEQMVSLLKDRSVLEEN